MFKCLPIFLIVLFLASHVQSQTVFLPVDKKEKVEIQLCTNTGSLDIPAGFYETGDSLFFVVSHTDGDDFSKGDLKDYHAIRIDQSGVQTSPSRLYGITNASKKTDRILIVYLREAVDFTKQFEFIYEEYRSEIMSIPEQYWPFYLEFSEYYDKGKQFKDEGKSIAAFQEFKYIISESKNAFQYRRFSNYNRVESQLVPEVIASYQDEQNQKLSAYKKNLSEKELMSVDELREVRIQKDSVIIVKDIFEPYYRITEQINQDYRIDHEQLITGYEELYQHAFDIWKKSVLFVIETGYYGNESKYEVFIELLARMLVYTNKVTPLAKCDSINIELVSNPEKEVPFLRRHIDLVEMMDDENWKDEFITVLQMINDNIENKQQLLGQTHLGNLNGLKRYENQPNFYIINAFNELVKGQFSSFRDNISKAIEKCSDKEMLYYLELWVFSYRYRNIDANVNMINNINEGLELEEKGLPNDATKSYEKAIRLGNSALPHFLIGRLKTEFTGDIFAAEQYISDAIELYPDFALARIYHIESQMENEQYKLALNEIEAVLNMPSLSIWYVYFLKARLLHAMGNFKGALHIINTYCEPLNSKSIDQYILLGDIYLALKNCEKAKESYRNAGDMNPNSDKYRMSMQKLNQECKF
jgi:hypothetical protein